MATRSLSRYTPALPAIFDDFFKPWNEWFDSDTRWTKTATLPAVNITENNNEYMLSVAAPGLKKEDFKIDLEGNMIVISSEKEEEKTQEDEKMTRKEYSYSSFSRSFHLPEDVNRESIDAHYNNGVLEIKLPKKEEAKKNSTMKHISVK